MNVVDWLLIGAVIVFALAGWHRGFVSGLLSFVGFLGGGLLAAFILPRLVEGVTDSELVQVVAVGVGVLVCALVGQVLASILGDRLRDSISWHPAQVVDNMGGAALNVLALAVVTWIMASALAFLPVTMVSQQVTESKVLVALDSLVPAPARNAFGDLRDLVGTTSVPRVFSGLAQITGPDVAAPDATMVSPAVAAARGSVVKVVGETPACGSAVSGSGFVVSPERVLTNAHVVAGVDEPTVRVRPGDGTLPATVVYFDPETDVAVLAVPGLTAPALMLDLTTAESGDPAVVAGFPLSGPFAAEAARIRTVVTAHGDDIYGRAGVDREVYILRALVQPGNSGGPLLSPEGRVYGMVFGADEEAESTGYALTAAAIGDAVSAGPALVEPVDTGTCRIRD